MGAIFFIAIIFVAIAFVVRSIDEITKTEADKDNRKELGKLSYYDFSRESNRTIKTNIPCHEYIGFDEDHRPYTYYISKGAFNGGLFLGAKYDIYKDVPIKFTKSDINNFIRNGAIKTQKDLYKRWNGKTPKDMPNGTYNK